MSAEQGAQPASGPERGVGTVSVDLGSGAVRADVVLAGAESARGRCVRMVLLWGPDDPFTVTLLVVAQPDHPALPRGQWVVLRDFLRYGLDTATGDGDVRIRPHPPEPAAAQSVELELARPGRPCRVRLDRALVCRFLEETERRIPVGAERSEELLDAFIERLLAT